MAACNVHCHACRVAKKLTGGLFFRGRVDSSQKTVDFFWVTNIQPRGERVKGILAAPDPLNKSELKSFISEHDIILLLIMAHFLEYV